MGVSRPKCGPACLRTVHRRPALPFPTVQIAAYNANGDLGARSSASAAFQLGTVAPSAPLAVTSTSTTPLTAALSFQAPASDGGSPITRYGPGSGQWVLPA